VISRELAQGAAAAPATRIVDVHAPRSRENPSVAVARMKRSKRELRLRMTDAMSHFRTFIVPYDFSVHARAALALAIDLGQHVGADLHLVHVIQSPSYAHRVYIGGAVPPPLDLAEVREGAVASLGAVVDRFDYAAGKLEPHVVEGPGVSEMVRESAENFGADLIVMGTRGRTGLGCVFFGSIAERTLRSASCPVLIVQASDEEAAQ